MLQLLKMAHTNQVLMSLNVTKFDERSAYA